MPLRTRPPVVLPVAEPVRGPVEVVTAAPAVVLAEAAVVAELVTLGALDLQKGKIFKIGFVYINNKESKSFEYTCV